MKINDLTLMELTEKRDDLEQRLDAAFNRGGKNEEYWHVSECLEHVYEEIYLREEAIFQERGGRR
jgi:hypothetical protein